MSELSAGDQNVVRNMRHAHKDALLPYTDEQIARAWRFFSQSDEYTGHPATKLFVEWCDLAKQGALK